MTYEKVVTSDFTIHRTRNSHGQIRKIGFELPSGEVLDYATILARHPDLAATLPTDIRIRRPRIKIIVGVASTIATTAAVLISHYWR